MTITDNTSLELMNITQLCPQHWNRRSRSFVEVKTVRWKSVTSKDAMSDYVDGMEKAGEGSFLMLVGSTIVSTMMGQIWSLMSEPASMLMGKA